MRLLLSTILIVSATGLFCHGLFLEDQARPLLPGNGTPQNLPAIGDFAALERIAEQWPYTQSAATARARLARSWAEVKPAGGPQLSLPDRVRSGVTEDIQKSPPFLKPRAAAALALLGLILAIFMPRQRFRSFSLLVFLLGAGALYPLFMDHAEVGLMVNQFPPLLHVYAWGAWVAIALVFLAGLLISTRRRDPQLVTTHFVAG